MQVATMRWLDRRVGVPLCAGLTLVRKLSDALAGRRRPGSPPADWLEPGTKAPSVLLVKLAEMGSTVLALPAIRLLQERYPGVRLHYLCFDENRAVLDLLPDVEWAGVHTIRTKPASRLPLECLATLRRLRQFKLDAAIDLEMFSRGSAALVYASGARVRAGYHRFHAEGLYCGDLFTHRLSYSFTRHTSRAFLALADSLARNPSERPLLKAPLDGPDRLPAFEPTAAERRAVLGRLAESGYPAQASDPILILNANASDLLPLRRWPNDRFVDLARRCVDGLPDVWVVLTGSPSEAPAIGELSRAIGRERVINMAGRTSLREVVALYGLARVLVTNDSGPAHFAALSGVRIVSLFGPETPDLYRPLSPGNRSLTAGLACSPCINVFNSRLSPCTDNRCMQGISVDEVFNAVEQALADQPGLLSAPLEIAHGKDHSRPGLRAGR